MEQGWPGVSVRSLPDFPPSDFQVLPPTATNQLLGSCSRQYHGMYQGHSYSDPRHPGGAGSADRHQSSPHNEPTTSPTEETSHRRAYTQPVGGTFLPPLPPLQSSSHPNHPSFSPNFYPSYSSHAASTSAPAGLHMAGYPNGPMSAPPPAGQGGYQYQLTSPLNQPTQLRGQPNLPPHHQYGESPRLPQGGGPSNWSSSPGMRPLSPTSPTTHLVPPGMAASSGSSSSGFPSATRTPGNLPPKNNKRRSGSVSLSPGSWDDEKYGALGDLGEETEEQPWGMPQDEYKALNPRDKKQVRNRIGARRFRAKRKNYVSSLEQSLRARDDELAMYKAQMDTLRQECNDLRGRLGMPLLSPPVTVPSSMPDGALGLVVNQVDGWSPKGESA